MSKEKDPIFNYVENVFSRLSKTADKQNKSLNSFLNIVLISLIVLFILMALLKNLVF